VSTGSTQNGVNAEAERYGFHMRRVAPDFHKIQWVLQCSRCPRQFTANWHGGISPERMARDVRRRQWDVGSGMRPLCPDCAHGKEKGPLPKPNSQSFKPWVPPETRMSHALLIAAEKRAVKDVVLPKLLDRVEEIKAKHDTAKDNARVARATLSEEQRLAAARDRVAHARAMRAKRLEETRIARERGEYALRQAQLKERCGTAAPAEVSDDPQAQQANAPQAEEEVMNTKPTPTPKITHAVFQCLDGIFDPEKRLYKSGYTDQRVARECGTSEEVVTYLRTETFGALAEDPRISAIRDDLELLGLEAAEGFAKLQKQLGELRSRMEQIAHR
jgi:hypothetical protein